MAARQRKPTDTVQLKLRFKEQLRADLEKSAKAKRVSLNTEIITRLGVSFDLETMAMKALAEWLGGTDNTVFHLTIAHEIRKIGNRPLRELLADPAAYERICAALLETLELWQQRAEVRPIDAESFLRQTIKIEPASE